MLLKHLSFQQLDMNHHLIGQEILSLAEMDVPPEDLVFHKFYMNKMNSSKKPKKKKKKGAEDEAAGDLFDVDGDDDVEGGDESDNEEIDNMLDSADLSDGDYDYDDLDKVANEDDDNLVDDAGDPEMDAPSDIAEGEDFDAIADDMSDNDDHDDDVQVDIGDVDDGSEEDGRFDQRKRKRKSRVKAGASPFASLEDYQHLLDDDNPSEKGSTREKKRKSKKKRKLSK